ncbi:snare-like protein [Cryphonectria parasitica EP155]|uniref:Snare-like protein n=1 Tax=Cryphonectria parasitica (strain ATCC 38755 / EP155) TaxID=660469 RepID=A0A9P4XY47_CRYP1|nr:snare-like protein [Cryphonectria parasitica EP155]KAF3762925.1 snare-like protein [Cryphonectria parasitica EP155]
MATAIPSIACLGVIGRNNNPLHISIFPSHEPHTNTLQPIRSPLQFSLLLSSTLDIFELRARNSVILPPSSASSSVTAGAAAAPMSGDYGLLHAVDERLAAYGFETNTGVKFVAVVDMRGRRIDGAALAMSGGGRAASVVGLRESDLKVVFKAMQSAYVRLLQNPFYEPDEHGGGGGGGKGGKRIVSRRFESEMRRIGEAWTVGVTSL